MALQFGYFIKNDFGLLLMLFWLFGLAMTSYSYVLSVMVKKSQAAVYLGFAVFIVGWVFQTVIFVARLPYRADTYYSETNVWGRVFFWVFALFPWNPLTKGILDFNEATLAATDPGGCVCGGEGCMIVVAVAVWLYGSGGWARTGAVFVGCVGTREQSSWRTGLCIHMHVAPSAACRPASAVLQKPPTPPSTILAGASMQIVSCKHV